jgi:hypothetical protein
LHGAGRDEKPCGDVPAGQPLADQTCDVALGRCQRGRAAGGSLALTAAALGVGDRLVAGQRRALGLGGVKVAVAHGVSQRRHRCLVVGVIDLEADCADASPARVPTHSRMSGWVPLVWLAAAWLVGAARNALSARGDVSALSSMARWFVCKGEGDTMTRPAESGDCFR